MKIATLMSVTALAHVLLQLLWVQRIGDPRLLQPPVTVQKSTHTRCWVPPKILWVRRPRLSAAANPRSRGEADALASDAGDF